VETLWRHSSSSELVTKLSVCAISDDENYSYVNKEEEKIRRGGQLLTFCVLCEIIPRGKK
jgi:hypothetical protein